MPGWTGNTDTWMMEKPASNRIMLKQYSSCIKVEAEAQVKQSNTFHSALTSSLACSVSLAAALVTEKRVLDFGEPGQAARLVGENQGYFEHSVGY